MTQPARKSITRIPFRPEWHQWDFFEARRQGYDYRWLSAGVGSGKTAVAVVEDLILATEINPGKKGLIVVPEFATFEDVILPEIEQWWPSDIYRIKRTSGKPSIRVRTKKGVSTILVRSAYDRGQVQKINGVTVSWVHMEEMARMRQGELAWEYATQRMRERGGAYNGIHVSSTPMPGFLPETFGVRDGIPREALADGVCTRTDRHWDKIRKKMYSFRYWVRRARVEDNTHNHPSYAARMRARFKGVFARQELDGEVVPEAGRIYPEWNPGWHVVSDDIAEKLWDRTVKRYLGVDWGWDAPGTVVCVGFTGDGEMVVIDEWYKRERHIEEQGYEAHKMRKRWGAGVAFCDHNPGNIDRWTQGFKWEGQRYSVPATNADKSWRAGTDRVRQMMMRRGGKPHPGFEIGNRVGAPAMYVAERCRGLISEYPEHRKKKPPIGIIVPKEGPTETTGHDHAIDAVRYVAQSAGSTWEFNPIDV